jgi:hypothetical protein
VYGDDVTAVPPDVVRGSAAVDEVVTPETV